MRPSIVLLPTYNEVDNIRSVVESLMRCDRSVEVLIVDDASPDGTAAAADELALNHPGRVHVMRRPGKSGLGMAYQAGFTWALQRHYEIIAQMDADGSHPPERLPAMLDEIEAGRADLVVGSRYVPGGGTRNWPMRRRVLSRLANLYARNLLGLDQRDVTGAFRAWTREALIAVDPDAITSAGYGFLVEMASTAKQRGITTVEIPITFVDRVHGVSKMTRRVAFEAIFMVWRLRQDGHRRIEELQPSMAPLQL